MRTAHRTIVALAFGAIDEVGNSVRAQRAIRDIVARLNANPYAAGSLAAR